MRISDAKEVFKIMIMNQVHVTPMAWGVKGIGKSSYIKQIAKDLEYRIFDIRLAQLESVDIKGMPFTAFVEIEVPRSQIVTKVLRQKSIKSIKNELKHYLSEEQMQGLTVKNVKEYLALLTEDYYAQPTGVLHHYSPDWFVQALSEGKCIIFFDELNRANRETRQAIFEIILDRTLNNKKLKDDVFICGAGNPANGNYDANAMDDSALKGRFLHMKIEPHYEDWNSWANQYVDVSKTVKNIDSSIISYLQMSQKSLYEYEDANDTQGLERFIGFDVTPDPRRWEFASKIVRAFDKVQVGPNEHFKDHDSKNSILTELLTGLIGNKEAIPYMRSRATFEKEIYLHEIKEWTPETEARAYRYAGKVKKDNNETEDQGLLSGRTRRNATVVAEGENNQNIVRADLIHRTNTDIVKNYQDMYLPEHAVNLAKYIMILPSENIQNMIVDLATKQAELSHTIKTIPANQIIVDGVNKIIEELKKYGINDNLKSIKAAIESEEKTIREKAERKAQLERESQSTDQ